MLCYAMVSDKPGGLSVRSHPLPQEIWLPSENRPMAILVFKALGRFCSFLKL